jgi:hypothetical protein
MWWRRASGCLIQEIKLVIKSHISKCQSLLNQYTKWLEDQKWKLIIQFEESQVTTSKSQCQNKIICSNPHDSWSQKEMKWQQSTLFKLMLKKCILYLFLSLGMSLYQEGYYIGCQQSLIFNKSLETQVRWVKHNVHTHYTSHWTKENWMVWFPKSDGPVWPDCSNN